jgi:hypothetical protein
MKDSMTHENDFGRHWIDPQLCVIRSAAQPQQTPEI